MPVTRKTYEIFPASGSRLKPGDVLEAGGRKVKLSKNGTAMVADAGLAGALVDKYGRRSTSAHGGQLLSVELEAYNENRHADKVARTHYWTMPGLPWVRYDQLGRRIR